ncbi:NEDD4-binding protein 1-like [Rattus norvegicus]|uniref:NEDD4-binding protein 1-like n=1 Tax=Rattus norvegicus TaxID=10116 RepID=UPI0019175217|nr:NEDD4-binding protein 1-like [Rattus norvegicus]
MENSSADPSHTSVKIGHYEKIVEKALTLLIACVISGVSVYQFSVAIFIYFLLEELKNRHLQLEILSKKVEKLAVQQQEKGVLGAKVAMISERLERPTAEKAREKEVFNCEPVVPDKIEAEDRQPIEHKAPPLTDLTEAGSPSALSFPAAREQRPENGLQEQTGFSGPNNKKPDCAEPPRSCSSPHLKPKAPQTDPALPPQHLTSHTDARLARPCDHIYSSITWDQRFQDILKIPYQLDLRNEPVREYLKHIVIDGNNVAMMCLIHLAEKTGGIIVTNDNLREFVSESVSFREIMSRRHLQYIFLGDIFMVPDDPLGRQGPQLEDFLQREAFLLHTTPKLDSQPNVCTFGLAIQSHNTQGALVLHTGPGFCRETCSEGGLCESSSRILSKT